MWCAENSNPSDLNSKINDDIIGKSNSDFLRFGPQMFLSEEQLLSNTYALFNKDAKRFDVLKKISAKNQVSKEGSQQTIAEVSLVNMQYNE